MTSFLHKLQQLFGSDDQKLRLYHMEYCYYCQRVRHAAKKLNVKLKMVDIYSDRAGRERLRIATGRTRVPVLGIVDDEGHEEFLPESEEIIKYLQQQSSRPMEPEVTQSTRS